METIQAAILIFDGVDLLDFTGPKEVLAAVRKSVPSDDEDEIMRMYSAEHVFNVTLLSPTMRSYVTTSDGTKVIPDLPIDQFTTDIQLLILPGGKGVQKLRKDQQFMSQLQKLYRSVDYVLSVCTGAYFIAELGIEGRKEITTHKRHLDVFTRTYPHLNVVSGVRYVNHGNLVITSGVSAGIDGALIIVSEIIGLNDAKKAAEIINYSWRG